MGAAICTGDRWVAVPSEGGHALVAPRTLREVELLKAAMGITLQPVCWEDLLSGKGLPLLHQAVCAVDGVAYEPKTAAQITASQMPDCIATLHSFCELLGRAAGDLALMFAARGGVYLKGGVLDYLKDFLPTSNFRAAFEDKGDYSNYMKTIPTYNVLLHQMALLGCAAAR